MANRRFLPALGHLEVDVVEIFAEITFSSGSITATSGKGIASAAIDGTSKVVTVTLSDRYNKLLHASAVAKAAAGTQLVSAQARITAEAVNNATPTVAFLFAKSDDGTAVAPADGSVLISIKLRNSSVS